MLYRAEDLRRVHGSRTVLHIDRLEIESHKVYTLIGPNGAGKSTLLQILAFLDRPTSGMLQFQDRPVEGGDNNLYELRRKVVLLDQNPIMFTGSVYKNVEFGLKVRKVVAAERRRRIAEALDLVGMASFIDYNARGLSGGETKRVALARCLVLQPDVLLCDEPTANVDNENQEIILDIIEQINKERRTSIVFSTHYLSQGQRLADHTLLLQNGMLSDIANENVFRIQAVDRRENMLYCQLTGQLILKLPNHILPVDVSAGKLHIDPSRIQLNPRENGVEEGNSLSGHIIELKQDSGRVRITVDAGVKMVLIDSLARYRTEKPCIGDKARLFISHKAIAYSMADIPHRRV
jgi:tungstate transport system ATP-binding protein